MALITSILITRPEKDAGPLAQKLSNLGYTPRLWPLIAIQNRPAPKDLSVQADDLYAFTSANGVRAAVAAALPARASFAVGPATLEACRQAGFPAQAADGDVASLAALIGRTAPSGRILHLSGRDLAGDLCGALTAQGLTALNIPLYAAVAGTEMPQDIGTAIAQDEIDAVLLYSKRSAQIFCRLMAQEQLADRMASKTFFCLSAAVAQTLHAQGYETCRVADVPTETALLDLLVSGQEAAGGG